MGENSTIEWTDNTFNPWWGCARVSPACDHCYAETFAHRFGVEWGKDSERRFFGDDHWREPLKWNRKATAESVRRRVFCASMADVFEDRRDLDVHRERLWDLIGRTPMLIWQLLTKRPQCVTRLVPDSWLVEAGGVWPDNVWIGTTVETQRWANVRVPQLLEVPAPIRFLSCEPLLEPIDLSPWLDWCDHPSTSGLRNVDDALYVCHQCGEVHDAWAVPKIDGGIAWVIVGGESGHDARPMHPEWARDLRRQCEREDLQVPFLFKQWGEWEPIAPTDMRDDDRLVLPNGDMPYVAEMGLLTVEERRTAYAMRRVGKKHAGRVLDGRTHDELPVQRF